MKKTLRRYLKISILIFLSFFSFISSFSQIKEIKIPSIIEPGGGGGPVNDDSSSFVPFTCNLSNTNPCNLIRNNTFSLSCTNNYSPFVNCIDYWTSSHGTPQLNNNLPLIQPNINHASMWASIQDDGNGNLTMLGEGIAVGIPALTVGSTYSLSLFKRFYSAGIYGGPDIDDFYVVLLKCNIFNAIRRYGEDYSIPTIPSIGAQVIYHETDVNNTSWQGINQSFVANDSYNVVWIFPKLTTPIPGTPPGANILSWLEVAYPEIKDIANCVPPPCTTPTVTPIGPIDYYTIIDNAPSGVTLTTNNLTGNQWYYNGNPIPNATAPSLIVGNGSTLWTSGNYYVKNGNCQSNTVSINFKIYGYGNYGEQQYILGSRSYPVNTPGFFCPYTSNNPIRQFNLGTSASYSWNLILPLSGATNVTIAPGSSSVHSYQALVNVGAPTSSLPNSVGNGIQAVADLNGMQKIIDFQYIIYPDLRSISVCSSSIVPWPMHHYYYWMIKPGGSGFDWEDYDFGPNATIIYPTDPSLFVSPYKLHIPGGNQLAQNIQVQFSAASLVKMDFYDNNNFGGCYKDYVTVSMLPGCFAGGNASANSLVSLIYPNPASNQLTISSTERIIKGVEIFGLFNNSILKISGNYAKRLNTNISSLQPGVYNCRITTDKGIENQKLIIKR